MEKLPPTSYIRMVDIWLIFSILIPFLEVSIITFKEFNNVDDSIAINHHGRMIEVASVSLYADVLFHLNWKILGSSRRKENVVQEFGENSNSIWYGKLYFFLVEDFTP